MNEPAATATTAHQTDDDPTSDRLAALRPEESAAPSRPSPAS